MRSKRHLNTQQKYFFGISNWFLKPEKKRLVCTQFQINVHTNYYNRGCPIIIWTGQNIKIVKVQKVYE